MKRLLFAALALIGLSVPALACSNPLSIKDGTGAAQNIGVSVDASSNCVGNTVIVDAATPTVKAKVNTSTPGASDAGLTVWVAGQNANGQTTASASAPVVLANNVANISGVTSTVAVTPTVTTAAYGPNQSVGGLLTFASVGRSPNNSGVLADVTLTIVSTGANQAGEYDVVFFDSNPSNTTWTDHAIPAINIQDVSKQRCVAKMTANLSPFTSSTVYKPQASSWQPCAYSGTTIYGVISTPASPTATMPFTTSVTLTVGVLQD